MRNGEHPTPTLDRGQARPRPVSSSINPTAALSALAEAAARHIGDYAFDLEAVLSRALDAHQGRGASPSALTPQMVADWLRKVARNLEKWNGPCDGASWFYSEAESWERPYGALGEPIDGHPALLASKREPGVPGLSAQEERMSNSSDDEEGSAQGQEGAGHPPAKDQAAETPGNGRVVDPAAEGCTPSAL